MSSFDRRDRQSLSSLHELIADRHHAHDGKKLMSNRSLRL
jgi:hypothetical protein